MLEGIWECCLTLTILIATTLFGIVIYLAKVQWSHSAKETERLRKLVERKQNERRIEFEDLRSKYKLGPEQNDIVCMEWEELLGKLQKKEITATKVLQAFIAKALEVCEKCNPVTDFITDAHTKARELDEMEGVKGPLHGIPFAVKDDNSVKGHDTTNGFAKMLYKPMPETSAMVKVLEDLGAIPFCKTNIPQTQFTVTGSDNPIFGTTTNCHSPKLSPGGSTSGSGALVGGGGSLFATGSDVGGSVRVPAAFNGCAGIKATSGRVASKDVAYSGGPQLAGINVAYGILGRNSTVVAQVMKYMLENLRQLKYDPKALPIQWNDSEFTSTEKLRIGYFTSFPYFPSMGDCAQTVLECKEHLESLGHTLIPVQPPDGYEFMKLFAKILIADNHAYYKECWKNEEIAECMKLVSIISKTPIFLLKIISRILTSKVFPFFHSKRSAVMLGVGASTTLELFHAVGEKNDLIYQIFAEWENLKLDAMISNVMPFPAPSVNAATMLISAAVNAALWNLVDFPAGVVTMRAESGTNLRAYDDEGDILLKFAKKNVMDSVGAPIGIQVIAKPFHEELVLRLMKQLQPFSTFKPKTSL